MANERRNGKNRNKSKEIIFILVETGTKEKSKETNWNTFVQKSVEEKKYEREKKTLYGKVCYARMEFTQCAYTVYIINDHRTKNEQNEMNERTKKKKKL